MNKRFFLGLMTGFFVFCILASVGAETKYTNQDNSTKVYKSEGFELHGESDLCGPPIISPDLKSISDIASLQKASLSLLELAYCLWHPCYSRTFKTD